MVAKPTISADGFKLVIEYGPSFREYGEEHGGKVRLPKALATLELAWTSEESEAEVVERLAQRKSALVLERMEERVAVQITVDPTPNAATFPEPRIKCSVKVVPSFPALRTIHASRTTASGTVSGERQVLSPLIAPS
ncbi:hypothetical protein DUNSADRAFT_2981 [Dunaliella salina]|uniref:Uncharacterized protein n=1 Tax=Dunaliella salina TaxID=3046 RepID=A0ABQ7GUU1_DUNSA|nr:hypothetical protein DUNSADRAFT_2981 [Dunaliella salina]|eukprot:KAF5838371.1 hypothetical protein DUNSADRAFT_2981 [Dunaliella salina]